MSIFLSIVITLWMTLAILYGQKVIRQEVYDRKSGKNELSKGHFALMIIKHVLVALSIGPCLFIYAEVVDYKFI